MPEFFIPYMPDPEAQERTWAAIKSFAVEQHGWKGVTEARVFRVDYVHDGKHMEAEVGKPHPYGYETTWERPPPRQREWVVAILEVEGGPYLVCTENRGVLRGEPILVGSSEHYRVIYFDSYEP